VDVLEAIEHGDGIYVAVVLKNRELRNTLRYAYAGELETRVLRTIWGRNKSRISLCYGVEPRPGFTMPILPRWNPQPSLLRPGRKIVVLVSASALDSGESVANRIAAASIWLVWGKDDPLVAALDRLVRTVGKRLKAGETFSEISSNHTVKSTESQVNLWALWHSNFTPIISADAAAIWVARVLRFEHGRAVRGEVNAALAAAPVVTARRDVRPSSRMAIMAALAHRFVVAPRSRRVRLLLCLGRIVQQPTALPAQTCLKPEQVQTLKELLASMEQTNLAQMEVSHRIQMVIAWLEK
jgi:hypothetical protein